MAELSFKINESLNKEHRYKAFISLIQSFCSADDCAVSTLANACAALKEAFGFFWVGFYLVSGEELTLGPFQGSVACTRIHKGRGVCGTAWSEGRSILVPDVNSFPGHIACSSFSRSEIVVPIWVRGSIYAVLDIDSEELNAFDVVDQHYLEEIAELLSTFLN